MPAFDQGTATRFSMRSGAMPGRYRYHRRADDDDGVFALREVRIQADPCDQQAYHGRDGESGRRARPNRPGGSRRLLLQREKLHLLSVDQI